MSCHQLDPADVLKDAAELRAKFLGCCYDIFRLREAPDLARVQEAVEHQYLIAERRWLSVVRSVLSRSPVSVSAILYAIQTARSPTSQTGISQLTAGWIVDPEESSTVDALQPFTEIQDNERKKIARFCDTYKLAFLKEYLRCARLLASVRSMRSKRKERVVGRRPSQGLKTEARWLHLGGRLQYLSVAQEIDRRKLAACLDRLGFKLSEIYPEAALEKLQSLRFPTRSKMRLESFRELAALDREIARAEKTPGICAALPKDRPWRPVEQKLSKARQYLRTAGFLLDGEDELTLQEFLVLCPSIKSILPR